MTTEIIFKTLFEFIDKENLVQFNYFPNGIDVEEITFHITNPYDEEKVNSQSFKDICRYIGVKHAVYQLSHKEEPFINIDNQFDNGLNMKPRLKVRDYNDKLILQFQNPKQKK